MLRNVAILGAGDLGATLARRLAELELARRIVLVDPDDGRARGKALDLAQSGPVERYDVAIEGCASLDLAGAADLVVIADPPALDESPLSPGRAAEWIATLVPRLGAATLLSARSGAFSLLEAAVERGVPRERVLASAPIAFAAAVRHRLAEETGVGVRDVAVLVLGAPPAGAVVPREGATVCGVPIDRLSAVALRRALESASRRTPGPVALAAAATRAIAALSGSRPSALPVGTVLQGEYGQRGVALAVPARIAGGRVQSVIEVPLDPVDRVAFENAAGRRR
jgi:malate dehydrogenase